MTEIDYDDDDDVLLYASSSCSLVKINPDRAHFMSSFLHFTCDVKLGVKACILNRLCLPLIIILILREKNIYQYYIE